ncbi:MAG: hydrogenase/urease maturation nickel metallochaperone HypA [Candidatus Omnitrophica bacterium]|nr:hydrogenase/urease maturation nickel metallochaperone HypA [Candidatus Omnitrophota bacterium]
MHETHIIKPLIKGICEHAEKEGSKVVSKIHIKIGELNGIKEDSFRETFKILAEGTPCAKAELELTFFPGTVIQVLSFDVE